MSVYPLPEGEDFTFISVPPVIVITSGTSRGCLIINIIPSDLVEGEEDIHLTINEETTQAVVLNGSTTVVIESDGGIHINFNCSVVYTLLHIFLYIQLLC